MSQKPDPKELAAQLKKPEGEFGIKVAEMLNDTNRHITDFTYSHVPTAAGHHILEIGFGNGRLMPKLLDRGNTKVSGIDFSADMVAEGKSILGSYIQAGKIELVEASVADIPFGDNSFDAVCTINTLYFWPNPLENAKEVLRVLKPGAPVLIGIRPKAEAEKIPTTKFGFTLYEDEEAIALLREAGFVQVEILKQKDPPIQFQGESMELTSLVVKGVKG